MSRFKPFPSDFEGGLRFLHLKGGGGGGGGGGGVCRKRRPWSMSLVIEDLIVSYSSIKG